MATINEWFKPFSRHSDIPTTPVNQGINCDRRLSLQHHAEGEKVKENLVSGCQSFWSQHCRYIGLAKTHLQHTVTVVAMNLVWLWHWWQEIPKAQIGLLLSDRCSLSAN